MSNFILPTLEEIETLHRKYAPTNDVFDLVFTHCNIVSEIAAQLAGTSDVNVDVELVRVGCLLHDIGVYPLFDEDGAERDTSQYITHGVRGKEILQKEGFPETICRFASHHTGTGITKAQIIERNLPLPHHDYLAETPEEKLVMYADKFHSKTEPPFFNSHEYYTRYTARFGADSVKSFADLTSMFGKPKLQELVSKYGYTLRG